MAKTKTKESKTKPQKESLPPQKPSNKYYFINPKDSVIHTSTCEKYQFETDSILGYYPNSQYALDTATKREYTNISLCEVCSTLPKTLESNSTENKENTK